MEHARSDTPVTARTRLARALQLRCPGCGGRGVVHGWLRLAPRCPTCGLRPDRGEPDHFVGGYLVNLAIAETVAAVLWATLFIWQWPEPNWDVLQWLAAGLMIALPLAIYPFTRLVFLATDMIFQPKRPGDYAEGEPKSKW
ncbi:MAG: DUF983 domain-containing protein [Gemmatimonadaceae bacterium]